MKNKTLGSAGLISLLVGVCATVFFFSYYYFSDREQQNPEMRAIQPETSSGTTPINELERSRANVDAVKATAELMGNYNKATVEALGE